MAVYGGFHKGAVTGMVVGVTGWITQRVSGHATLGGMKRAPDNA